MQQFTISHDGKLSDAHIQEVIDSLEGKVKDLDERVVEAHLSLVRATAVCNAMLSDRYEEMGLSIARVNTLRWLYLAEGHRFTLTELSARLEARIPTVLGLVKALEADDWVRREQSQQDRRVTYVHMTDTGLSRFAALLPRTIEIWSEIWSGITPNEQETLSHILAKFRMNLLSKYFRSDRLLPHLESRRKQRKR
jgi:DNA-binding MarR family transcriptional regulator